MSKDVVNLDLTKLFAKKKTNRVCKCCIKKKDVLIPGIVFNSLDLFLVMAFKYTYQKSLLLIYYRGNYVGGLL